MATTNPEEAFQADVNAEIRAAARSRMRPTRSYQDQKRKKHATGIDGSSVYEETPLLEQEAASEEDSLSGAGSNRSPPEWSGARDFEDRPWWRKPSIFWLLPPFLLATFAFGGTLVPKVDLITTLICRQYFAEQQIESPNLQAVPVMFGQENPQCHTPEIQSMVSKFTLYGSVITGLLSAITSPKLGSLSDRYGRTRIISLNSLGLLATEIITILAARMPDTISVNWLLLSFFLDGLSGSFVASMALTHAYATDCTPPAKRNVTFGYFHGCLFTGIALGPLFAGFVVKSTGSIVSVFWTALGAHLFFLSFVLLFIPESLTEERQHAAREKESLAKLGRPATSNDWHTAAWTTLRNNNLLAPLKTLWPTGQGSSAAVRRNLVAIAAVDTVMFAIAMGSVTVVIIYAEGMFHWNTFQASLFVSIANICRVTNLIVILPLVCRLIRGPRDPRAMGESGSDNLDLYIIRAAILFDILGYVGYATIRTGPLFIASGALASIGGMGSPTLQSALTKHVPPEQTGAVLGAVGLLHALGRVVGPLVFNGIYSATVGKFKQTVFVCLGSTFGVAFVFSWFIRPHVHWEDAGMQEQESNNAEAESDLVR